MISTLMDVSPLYHLKPVQFQIEESTSITRNALPRRFYVATMLSFRFKQYRQL